MQNQTQPGLPVVQESRLYNGLWQRGHGSHNVDCQLHSNPIPDAAGDKRLQTTPTYAPPRKEKNTKGREGEYFEEEMKVDFSPSWLEPPTSGVTLYAYGGEYSVPPGFLILDTALLLDRTDAELQDSRFGCARPNEMDIKEHGVKGRSTAPDPQNPGLNITEGTPRRLSTRDAPRIFGQPNKLVR